MVRRAALVAVILLMVGCTAGRPAPAPSHAEAPAQPAAVESAAPVIAEPAPSGPPDPCLGTANSHNYGQVDTHYVMQGTCRTVVGSDDVWVYFILAPGISAEAARAALRVTASAQPEVEFFDWDDQLHMRVHFPPGQPGERLAVRLSNLVDRFGLPLDMGFDLERVPTPGVSVEWRDADGVWRLLDHIVSLPRIATDLRFRIQGKVSPAKVEEILTRNGIPAGGWTDGVSTVRTIARPPGHIVLYLDQLESDDGLQTAHSIWEIFFGASPQLVALDPANGAEQVIGNAPLNAAMPSLAPDGARVAFFSVHPVVPWAAEAWVMDTASGNLTRLGTKTNWPFIRAYWSGPELMVTEGQHLVHWRPGADAAERVAVQSLDFAAMSPDGRYLAGFIYDWRREDEHYLAPGSIVLYDVGARKERFLAVDQVKVRVPHSEFPAYLLMEFTPDSKGLMIREPLPANGGAYHWVRLDLETQALSEVPGLKPAAPVDWLAGPGGYQAQRTGAYTTVSVKAPDGTLKTLGEGLVTGWRADGRLLVVRWENGKDLREAWGGE